MVTRSQPISNTRTLHAELLRLQAKAAKSDDDLASVCEEYAHLQTHKEELSKQKKTSLPKQENTLEECERLLETVSKIMEKNLKKHTQVLMETIEHCKIPHQTQTFQNQVKLLENVRGANDISALKIKIDAYQKKMQPPSFKVLFPPAPAFPSSSSTSRTSLSACTSSSSSSPLYPSWSSSSFSSPSRSFSVISPLSLGSPSYSSTSSSVFKVPRPLPPLYTGSSSSSSSQPSFSSTSSSAFKAPLLPPLYPVSSSSSSSQPSFSSYFPLFTASILSPPPYPVSSSSSSSQSSFSSTSSTSALEWRPFSIRMTTDVGLEMNTIEVNSEEEMNQLITRLDKQAFTNHEAICIEWDKDSEPDGFHPFLKALDKEGVRVAKQDETHYFILPQIAKSTQKGEVCTLTYSNGVEEEIYFRIGSDPLSDWGGHRTNGSTREEGTFYNFKLKQGVIKTQQGTTHRSPTFLISSSSLGLVVIDREITGLKLKKFNDWTRVTEKPMQTLIAILQHMDLGEDYSQKKKGLKEIFRWHIAPQELVNELVRKQMAFYIPDTRLVFILQAIQELEITVDLSGRSQLLNKNLFEIYSGNLHLLALLKSVSTKT